MARLMQFPELLQLLDSPSLAPAEKYPLAVITAAIARNQLLTRESKVKLSYKALKLTTYPLKLTFIAKHPRGKRHNN